MKNPNDNNLPPGVKYEETTSDLHPANKYKTGHMGNNTSIHGKNIKLSPCQNHALEAEDERELELPKKCIKQEDYSTCPNKNVCQQCKID